MNFPPVANFCQIYICLYLIIEVRQYGLTWEVFGPEGMSTNTAFVTGSCITCSWQLASRYFPLSPRFFLMRINLCCCSLNQWFLLCLHWMFILLLFAEAAWTFQVILNTPSVFSSLFNNLPSSQSESFRGQILLAAFFWLPLTNTVRWAFLTCCFFIAVNVWHTFQLWPAKKLQ